MSFDVLSSKFIAVSFTLIERAVVIKLIETHAEPSK